MNRISRNRFSELPQEIAVPSDSNACERAVRNRTVQQADSSDHAASSLGDLPKQRIAITLQVVVAERDLVEQQKNCGSKPIRVKLNVRLHAGFGVTALKRDGEWVESYFEYEKCPTFQRFENVARKDPDHDWRVLRRDLPAARRKGVETAFVRRKHPLSAGVFVRVFARV